MAQKCFIQGKRVYKLRCVSPECDKPVAAVATFRQRCPAPLSVRFELCEGHTVLEIFRHADAQWTARVSTIPGGPYGRS